MNEVQWALIRKYVLSYRGQRSYLITKQFIDSFFFIPLSPTPESFDRKELCSRELEGRDVAQFQEAIEDLYYFEFVYGELSVQLVCRGVCWLVSACVYCDCLASFCE